jgi:hypothetical protein
VFNALRKCVDLGGPTSFSITSIPGEKPNVEIWEDAPIKVESHLCRTVTMATGVDAKLLKTTKFPPEFNQKVDMTKVNLQVMKKHVSQCLRLANRRAITVLSTHALNHGINC